MPTTRTFTLTQVVLIVALALALVFGGFVIGHASSSEATASPTTYYACVKAGTMSKVGTSRPTCLGKGNTRISWNQVGPAGPAGSPGAAGATGAPGAPGAGMNYLAGTADLHIGSTVAFTTALSTANYTIFITPKAGAVSCQTTNQTTAGFDVSCTQVVEASQQAHVCTGPNNVLLIYCGETDDFTIYEPVSWVGPIDWFVVPTKNP